MNTAFEISDKFVDDACAQNPVLATQLGIPGSDHEWGEGFGLEGVEQNIELVAGYRKLIEPFLDDRDPQERLAARVMVSELDEQQVAHDNGDHFRTLRHMASPFHHIRLTFDVMSADSPEARESIVNRLRTVSKPLEDYRRLLEAGLDSGIVSSRRQVESVIDQAESLSDDPASIDEVVARAAGGADVHPALAEAADKARAAYRDFADWLQALYLPAAPEEDGVESHVYLRSANRLVGLGVDPDEAYSWGWEEFSRLLAEMERVAELILPGGGVEATKEFLETDPSVTASGTGELLSFVERILDEAVDELSGSHFEVPDEIRPLTVQLAPPGSPLGVYYRRPSEDFSRPGGVWYSVGDQDVFPLYQHVSTAYHEGFPGHHLQNATAMYRRDRISRFQRVLTWCPGYGEGWGMYAEVLMGELGYLEDHQHYFGMLAKQMYRAARVVVDIGLHLGMKVDDRSPRFAGEDWDFDKAVEFMRVYGFRTLAQARDEVLRYLGWPGQAISYKLGEREILSIRKAAQERLGGGFDLRAFHSTVIDNGAMRLDLLRDVVEEQLN
ncbi:MAG: DUF885 domain-containing protein [Actinomycetota bacterium]